jgi:hypothetical protein
VGVVVMGSVVAVARLWRFDAGGGGDICGVLC